MSLQLSIKKKLPSFTLDVSFETGDGILALLGASGSGKSMTLKCIAGIERPDEGRIVLDGRVLFDAAAHINLPPQKRRVGYLFQDYALFPNMTVRENVLAGMGPVTRRNREELGQRAADLLRRFHIEELASLLPSRLSGGQKQRTALARLMAQEPDAILLDEPFSALDSSLKWQLEQEMRAALLDIQKPVVFVTHSRDEVFHLAKEVGCLSEGRLEVVAPLKEFFGNPRTRTAAVLSGCKNVSLAERKDPHLLCVPEWGITFVLAESIPPWIKGVGIRAHSFERAEVLPEGDHPGRTFLKVCSPQIVEDPFEWIVLFQASREGGVLQWRVPKRGEAPPELPEYLSIDHSRLMLLR